MVNKVTCVVGGDRGLLQCTGLRPEGKDTLIAAWAIKKFKGGAFFVHAGLGCAECPLHLQYISGMEMAPHFGKPRYIDRSFLEKGILIMAVK